MNRLTGGRVSSTSFKDFESEMWCSPYPVMVVLMLLGFVIQGIGESLDNLSLRFHIQLFGMALYAIVGGAILLCRWKPQAGAWFIIAMLVVIIGLADTWLPVPGVLALMAVPVGLSAILLGSPAAAGVAVVVTMMLLLWPRYVRPDVSRATIGIFSMEVWILLGLMFTVHRRLRHTARWSWDYYLQALRLQEELRNRQAQMKQALEDLAHANLQLQRLNALAQGLRQEAEEARRAKEEFVTNVSHELRTPLNMIIGFTEMIAHSPEAYGGEIPPALLADLAVIHRNAEHLSALIDDVLDLSQIETGQMALTKEYVSLREIIEAAVTAVRPLFESKGLYLEMNIAADLPLVFCDRTRIREVVLNLLSNAGRFTEQGGVTVRAWQEEADVVVSVADTGPGISEEDMHKLFQPFQQIDGSIRRRYGGSGLGLAISKRFIELHEGRIWVESTKGRGTTFYFRLPISPGPPPVARFERWLTPHWEYLERSPRSMAPMPKMCPRLVVLENGDSLQRLLTRYLDDVEIVSVTTLEEALQAVSHEPAQALLINDMSVEAALERLGRSGSLPYGTPAIVCSVPEMCEITDALGVSEYLVKPVSREQLAAALDRVHLSGNTILIVDDEPEALRLFRRMLTSLGRDYRVLRARDGEEAMTILQRTRPDVILLDLVMPNMDGFRLLAAKNQDPALRDIPVIVISARDPAGQPIVSNALAVMRGGGLSVPRLLACIEALTAILSTAGPIGDPGLKAVPADGPVYE